MSCYERNHDLKPILGGIFGWTKTSMIKNEETGEVGEGVVWDDQSFEEADDKAWEDLEKKAGNR